MARLVGCVLGVCSALLLGGGPALAGEPSAAAPATAAELVKEGTAAARAKRWDACILSLSEALALDPAPHTAGQLGLCEEQAGKHVAAYDHLQRALDAAPSSSAGEPWKGYRAAFARVLERVALVWLTVYPREARVLLDGRPLGRADGRSFAVEPGKHTITAKLDGYADAVRAVSVRAGDVPHMDIQLTTTAASASSGGSVPKPWGSVSTPLTPPAASSGSPRPVALATSGPAERPRAPWYVPATTPRGVLVSLAYVGLATSLVSGVTSVSAARTPFWSRDRASPCSRA